MWISSTPVTFVLAEGSQSNMQMENSKMNVPEEEKIHLDVAFFIFSMMILWCFTWSPPNFFWSCG